MGERSHLFYHPPVLNPRMLIILLSGCSASLLPADTARAPSPDTGAAATGDSAEDSAEEVEVVPDAPEAGAPSLCLLTLQCDGEIVDEPRVGCDLTVSDGEGTTHYSGRAGVEIRGRSSASFPKPQYLAELWDDDGADTSADLLGMGKDDDWILNGAYIDRALIRNKLAYDSFQAAGGAARYAPQSAYCTLTLDGQWVGIYLLTERIKRDDDRIDLPDDESGAAFIVKLDDETALLENTAGYGIWQLVYPRADTASAEAQAAVSSWLDGWQTAATSGGDVFAWVDRGSAMDFVLIQEMTRNNDAYYLSIYAWKAPDGLIHLTPWDSDLTLGQPSYNDNENPEGWVAYRPALIAAFADDPDFAEDMAARWAELRAGAWSDAALLERIDVYRESLGQEVYANFEVLPIEEITFGWSGENYLYEVHSYDEEYARVRAWLKARLAWMDANIAAWAELAAQR